MPRIDNIDVNVNVKAPHPEDPLGRATSRPLRIGELSQQTGISPRALRYYEERDLLRPERSTNRYRAYPPESVEQTRTIQALFAAGLNSEAIAAILPCTRQGLQFDVCPELLERLKDELRRLDEHLHSIQTSHDLLADALKRAQESQPTPAR